MCVLYSTCEGHLIGDPVNGQHTIRPLITGLDEELLRGCVPVERADTQALLDRKYEAENMASECEATHSRKQKQFFCISHTRKHTFIYIYPHAYTVVPLYY